MLYSWPQLGPHSQNVLVCAPNGKPHNWLLFQLEFIHKIILFPAFVPCLPLYVDCRQKREGPVSTHVNVIQRGKALSPFYSLQKRVSQPRMWHVSWHMLFTPALWGQRQVDLCENGVRLVYTVNSRTARDLKNMVMIIKRPVLDSLAHKTSCDNRGKMWNV